LVAPSASLAAAAFACAGVHTTRVAPVQRKAGPLTPLTQAETHAWRALARRCFAAFLPSPGVLAHPSQQTERRLGAGCPRPQAALPAALSAAGRCPWWAGLRTQQGHMTHAMGTVPAMGSIMHPMQRTCCLSGLSSSDEGRSGGGRKVRVCWRLGRPSQRPELRVERGAHSLSLQTSAASRQGMQRHSVTRGRKLTGLMHASQTAQCHAHLASSSPAAVGSSIRASSRCSGSLNKEAWRRASSRARLRHWRTASL
jgi:hypothetical protein